MKLIEIRTGSDSDIPKIADCYELLKKLDLAFSARILSAHRTPGRMVRQASRLLKEGFVVSIAAAGGSAHLPGMTASETIRPVIGIPVRSSVFGGIDSLLSIIQMPEGVPTGSVGIGDAANAALCAAKIAALHHRETVDALRSLISLPPKEDLPATSRHAVGVIDAAGDDHRDALSALGDQMRSFGLEPIVYSADDESTLEALIVRLENAGVTALAVPCDIMRSGSIAGVIGAATHLPVVGLPLLRNPGEHDPQVVLKRLAKYLLPAKEGAPGGMVSMGINRVKNTALYLLQIAAIGDSKLEKALHRFRRRQYEEVVRKDNRLIEEGPERLL